MVRTVLVNVSCCCLQMVPPGMLLGNPVNSLATRSVRVAMNKVKCPIFCTCVSTSIVLMKAEWS